MGHLAFQCRNDYKLKSSIKKENEIKLSEDKRISEKIFDSEIKVSEEQGRK